MKWRGGAAVGAVAVALAAIPWGLVVLAGNPLPARVPSGDAMARLLTQGDVEAEWVVKGLAAVCWLAWIQLVIALGLEVIARRRGRPTGSHVVLAGGQAVAAFVVSAVAGLMALSETPGPDAGPALTTLLSEITDSPAADPPAAAVLREQQATRSGASELSARHVVDRRETLWSVAELRLGSGSRWREIFELNRAPAGPLDRPDRALEPGWVLQLPPSALPSDSFAIDASDDLRSRASEADTEVARAAAELAQALEILEGAGPGGPTVAAARAGGDMAAAMAGGGLLAGGVAWTLDRRRQRRLARRSPGEPVETPSPEARRAELALRAAAARGRLPQVDVLIRTFARNLRRSGRSSPPIIGINVADDLSLLFGAPDRDPVQGFSVEDAGFSWVAPLPHDAEAQPADDAPWPLPALVTVGHTDKSQVLVNLEGLDILEVSGSADLVAETMITLAIELATGPWAGSLRVLAVGFAPELTALPQVAVHDDLGEIIEGIEGEAESAEGLVAQSEGSDALQARIAASADITPTVVLCAGHQDRALVGRLRSAALRSRGAGVIACVASDSATSGWRLRVEDESVTLDPVGVTFRRHRIATEARLALATLVAPPQPPTSGLRIASLAPRNPGVTGRGSDGPEVCVLGPVHVAGGAEVFQRQKALELVAYLATHPDGVDGDALAEALWPDRLASPGTLHSTTALARRALGSGETGPWLPPASGSGVYRLHPAVRLDWSQFGGLAAAAQEASDDDGRAMLRQALEMVRGRPFSIPNGEYMWAHAEALMTAAAAEVTDVAHDLARRCLSVGDHRGAWWATQQGLLAAPGNEQLYRDRMLAADAAGNPAGVRDVMEELLRALGVEADDIEHVLHPSTVELFERLARRERSARTLLSRA